MIACVFRHTMTGYGGVGAAVAWLTVAWAVLIIQSQVTMMEAKASGLGAFIRFGWSSRSLTRRRQCFLPYHQPQIRWHAPTCSLWVPCSMVRNVDLPECVVFYGIHESFLVSDHKEHVQELADSGVLSLLEECRDTDTAVVIIPPNNNTSQELSTSASWTLATASTLPAPVQSSSLLLAHLPARAQPKNVLWHYPKSHPPNPLDLYEALNSITVKPRPFGGSSGFGAKQYADPERTPLPSRTVVVCRTLDETRAARFCGTRVLCVNDNDLADAIVDWNQIDFYLDDISTPGSFWLNPPHPRDDEGNRVDVEYVIEQFNSINAQQQLQAQEDEGALSLNTDNLTGASSQEAMSDDELQRILADLAPL